MPYKSEKMRLSDTQDRRKRLTTEQKNLIRRMYSTGTYSLNDLAKLFHVSKKTILLTINKDSAEIAREYRKTHWKQWQKSPQERAEIIKEHRRYKHNLYLKGELKK